MTTHWYQTNKFKYAVVGALFGVCFPVIAVSIDLLRLGLAFNLSNIAHVQNSYPIHYIIDTAPLFLGLFALIGGIRQDKIEAMNNLLEGQIEEKQQELQTSAQDLERSQQEKNRLSTELNVAQKIQLSMLPLTFPAFPSRSDIDVYAKLIPAKEVGGDFYDFYFLNEDHFCFVVGDISGKGVSAALMMAVCKALIKSKARVSLSTAQILTEVNNDMAKDNNNYMFATVFIAILNTKTQTLSYSNAGHPPSLLKKANGGTELLGDLHGPVIGAMEGLNYKETQIQLSGDDAIFAYTDGITEAHNPQEELFSTERLVNVFDQHDFNTNSLSDLLEHVLEEVRLFEAGNKQFDDITAICIKYNQK